MRVRLSALLMLLLELVDTPLAGMTERKVSGRVLDYKSRRDLQVGIPGVVVEAFDSDRKLVADTLTDGAGSYALMVVGRDELVIEHKKVGYLRYPEVYRWIAGEEDLVIYMMARDAEQGYYEEIGDAIIERLASSRDLRRDLTYELSSFLDFEPNRYVESIVLSHLAKKLSNQDLVAEVRLSIQRPSDQEVMESATASDKPVSKEAAGRGASVPLLEEILFDVDDARLSNEAKEILTRTVNVLKSRPDMMLLIVGNADVRGSNKYNLALAERRVQAVRGYILQLGLDASRVQTKVVGEEKPICTDLSEECQALNRRVLLIYL